MKKMVISGINLFEGGPKSVYKDCLDNMVKSNINKTYEIYAFVHKKELFEGFSDKITFVEFPKSRNSYFYRIWYEYIYFFLYSKRNHIDVWLSLHDMTPNVAATKRYVYCHNPSPFMKTELKSLKYSYKNFLFSLFYKYLYKINIKKNTAVIVQQDWIRDEFINLYKLNNVIVARPAIDINNCINTTTIKERKYKYQFIYPAFPRFFKNFEVICKACIILENAGYENFEVFLTLDGTENRYSKDLVKKFGMLSSIKFIGIQHREKIFELYKEVDCLIFPSNLETWGLPISEYKSTNKPMLVADLPYAHETVGTYKKVCFFHQKDAIQLANLMEKEILNTNIYSNVTESLVQEPYAKDWEQLLSIIL